jgi:hypothetical protein
MPNWNTPLPPLRLTYQGELRPTGPMPEDFEQALKMMNGLTTHVVTRAYRRFGVIVKTAHPAGVDNPGNGGLTSVVELTATNLPACTLGQLEACWQLMQAKWLPLSTYLSGTCDRKLTFVPLPTVLIDSDEAAKWHYARQTPSLLLCLPQAIVLRWDNNEAFDAIGESLSALRQARFSLQMSDWYR